ncbi:group 1 truncated hemoglobin [Chitinimonas arctica]|uniref:Group 1 truncated hemoglobin n=1 Tax=Chitinimonas arctica TaxID=2594795 RepID=A0A516SG05_9NEIS|nr:group 1 truncated hemoglobin [Chitinimonas arctica]QDQ27096.1 group 1 truncated hemoglobin [Chitinimonas arctica]
MRLRLAPLLSFALLIPPVPADSLYQRLGGDAGVAAITADLLAASTRDPATRGSFVKVDLRRLQRMLAEHLCHLSGGPCQYTGDTMKQVHGGLGISEAAFYAMVENLRNVLDAHQVAQADKNALLAILAPMKRDIVEYKR